MGTALGQTLPEGNDPLAPAVAAPQDPGGGLPSAGIGCMEQLICLGPCELNALYQQGKVGTIPEGYVAGRAIFWPGTAKAFPSSDLIQHLWKGKVFYPCQGVMLNKLACNIEANPARVFYGDSWLDGKPSIIMDYCGTSRMSERIRDEIREIAPGLFLGLTYRRQCPCPKIRNYFALQRPCCGCPTPAP
jgi:hypothetical protein